MKEKIENFIVETILTTIVTIYNLFLYITLSIRKLLGVKN
jgi:hypothetical protein